MKFCTKCGNSISEDTKFCNKCGNPIQNADINDKKNETQSINISKNEIDKTQIIDISKDEIDKTQIIDISKLENDIKGEKENNEYYEPKMRKVPNSTSKNKKNIESKSSEKFLSGIIPKILIVVVLIVLILVGIFFNKIRGQYYIVKCNNAVSEVEKLEYATKAVKALESSETKDLLKNTLIEISGNDVNLAEQKLQEISSMLSQKDFQSIASDIKDRKVDKLCSEGKYEDALKEFNEIDKLGGNFKSNKHYEDVMLNVISKITGNPLRSSKNLLMENDKLYFDNFDDDSFDEIIELKSINSHSYNSEIKLNLYKVKDGKYKLVDNKTVNNAFNGKIQGVYNYDTDKKGVFINYESATNSFATCVFGVGNNTLGLKGTISGNNYTKPEDVDNDGIYEILSKSTSFVSSSQKATSKWYKVYEDARTPTEVTVTKGKTDSSKTTNTNSGDYILKDSDKAYLTKDDLKALSKDDLALARNEIFARHGYVFNEEQFKNYFTAKSWYVPNSSYDGSDSSFNQYEKANYAMIQELEKK
ncbi:YARHG domain-containing protein [Clostridium uliginosum]|uniref:Zinc-ribbon domain-containing protein n=1 Tax=Clostridium uliginosum TaxID=119641 RepID=A0A1I1JT19_9CLOT|nr:YARHG domain-containing protein [Clostridium uliginosum]SFC51809.1 zinc-ribbon domain-containing protein [Clostridium uliginosum]